MTAFIDFHGIAPAAIEGMIYSLIEGTVLALLIWLVLRLLPRKNSGTQFTVWFSTLLAVTILPLLRLLPLTASRAGATPSAAGLASGHGVFTLPASWAVYAFLGWAVIALANLARVAVGFRQVYKLRQSCVPVDLKSLSPEVQEIAGRFQQSRPVLIGTSSRLHVPTAVGFLNPAILLPCWLVAEVSATELKHILLHEMAHLQRRDDWTNLAQKLVKAVLFFHPLVWWIERRLTLEREVACDDAVLVQTESPRIYAQCLARMAEKSFLRRQIALAQAAVSRMRQLSVRVAQILDLDRPRSTQLWKPAIPLVMFCAVICGLSLQRAPVLIGFAEENLSAPMAVTWASPAPTAEGQDAQAIRDQGARFRNAGFKVERGQQRSVPGKAVRHQQLRASVERAQPAPRASVMLASYPGYVIAREEFVVTMTSQGVVSEHWHVQVWQLRVLVPAHREIAAPRKT